MNEFETLGYLISLYETLGDDHREFVERSIDAFEWGEVRDGKRLLLKADICMLRRIAIADMILDLYDLKL